MQSFLHLGLLHEDHQDLYGQTPEQQRVRLQRQHVPQQTLLHALELLLEPDIRRQRQINHKLLARLHLKRRRTHLQQKGRIFICDRTAHQQPRLQLQRVVLLVGQHEPPLIGDRLVDDDADQPFLGVHILQHLLAENAGEFDAVDQLDGMHAALLADEEFPAEGRAPDGLLGIGGHDDVDGGSRLHHHAHLVLAVVAVLPQQEEPRRYRPLRQLQRQEGHRWTLQRQDHLPVLSRQDGAQVQLAWQFQQGFAFHLNSNYKANEEPQPYSKVVSLN